MAFQFNEPAYYGDLEPTYVPDKNPSRGKGGGVQPSGDITEIDFNKVEPLHAPWIQKKSMRNAMSKVSPNRSTNLFGANKRVEEIVSSLKECAK
jgi:hypothetical protein